MRWRREPDYCADAGPVARWWADQALLGWSGLGFEPQLGVTPVQEDAEHDGAALEAREPDEQRQAALDDLGHVRRRRGDERVDALGQPEGKPVVDELQEEERRLPTAGARRASGGSQRARLGPRWRV